MNPATIDQLADTLSLQADFNLNISREPIRPGRLSGVERLHVHDHDEGDTSVIFKYAAAPLTSEASVLHWLHIHGVPVPWIRASDQRDGLLGMLLDDPGEPIREATLADAAKAAVAIHRAPHLAGLMVYDLDRLAGLPTRCTRTLSALQAAGRWNGTENVARHLDALAKNARNRAAGATAAPWGMLHGEFHPTSVHVSTRGWRLLDCQRAFIGPGLLDLASWQGTATAPDLDAVDALIDAYVDAGGHENARWNRGGLPAARWAIGWHRLWLVDWNLEQLLTWMSDDEEPAYREVISRHLAEACDCLC